MKPVVIRYTQSKEYFFKEGCFINELSNRAQDDALSIARARVRPGERTRRHRLHDRIERYVVLQGNGEVELDDLPPQAVSAGDVVTIPVGCPQRIRNTGTTDLVFLALCTPRFVPECYVEMDDGP